jgi:hypothetical protein
VAPYRQDFATGIGLSTRPASTIARTDTNRDHSREGSEETTICAGDALSGAIKELQETRVLA